MGWDHGVSSRAVDGVPSGSVLTPSYARLSEIRLHEWLNLVTTKGGQIVTFQPDVADLSFTERANSSPGKT